MNDTKIKKWVLFLSGWLTVTAVCAQGKYTSDWASIDSRPVPQWFTDAKFGIFVHWGIYSVPAWGPLYKDGAKDIYDCYSEHYWNRLATNHPLFMKHHREMYGESFKYQDFAYDFKCEMFNPDEWAKLFQDAGAKYVVLTSKHHDGYALWPSEYAWNWNAVDVGPHRDILGDLTAAVKKTSLHMGYYYSLLEWFNPLYQKDVDTYVERHMIPQMKELVTKYEPEIVWTDGEWDYPSERLRSTDFLAWLYNESPVKERVVVNDRWGKETRSKHGGFYTTEYDLVHDNVNDTRIQHPWEECRGIGHSFGYSRNENLEDYSSSEELVHLLIEKVAMGGNLLLNVGPTADGRIPVIMQQRLSDMGKWLSVNGEAIYSTKPWDVASSSADLSAYYTTKGKDLYVIFTKYPAGAVTIKGIDRKPASAKVLGTSAKVSYTHRGKNLTIQAPALTIGEAPCDYAWVIKVTDCL